MAGKTMNGLVLRAPHDAAVEELAVPDVGVGDVLVRVRACGVCGSDLAREAGEAHHFPVVLGHEFAGEVVEVGQDVEEWQAGDRAIGASESTLLRYGRAIRLIEADRAAGKVTVETLQHILCDHFNHSNAICRHPDPALTEIERSATLASMIVDLTAGEIIFDDEYPWPHCTASAEGDAPDILVPPFPDKPTIFATSSL